MKKRKKIASLESAICEITSQVERWILDTGDSEKCLEVINKILTRRARCKR